MDCDEALQRDGHSHENRPGDRDLVERIQKVRKHHDVRVRSQIELLAEALQNTSKKLKKKRCENSD